MSKSNEELREEIKEELKEELGKIKAFLHEFKTFAMKGNMIDMAVGMIVGGAFTALVNSIVNNIATPLIGILIGIDLKDLVVVLPRLYGNAEPNVLAIGMFLNSLISFVVVAFVVFLFVKAMNKFRHKEDSEPEAPMPKEDIVLLTEIRDLLKAANGVVDTGVESNEEDDMDIIISEGESLEAEN